jgi:hypothetical protein
MTRRVRERADEGLAEAEWTALSVLGGIVLSGGTCQVRGCTLPGEQARNGVWCRKHLKMMEWNYGAHVYVR